MTLPTMKAGDRVRITVEGEVNYFGADNYSLILDGAECGCTTFYTSELTAPTARIEVLPPPIDPDLVLAREVRAKQLRDNRCPILADQTIAGREDRDVGVQIALAAIKAARAGKAVQG